MAITLAPFNGNVPLSSYFKAAIENNDHATLEDILDKGADVNEPLDSSGSNKRALHLAAEMGNFQAMMIIFGWSKMPVLQDIKDSKGWTPLHYASSIGRSGEVEYLIAKGCDINAANGFGNTPLMLAAEAGHLQALKILLNKGAHTHLRNLEGFTALGLCRSEKKNRL